MLLLASTPAWIVAPLLMSLQSHPVAAAPIGYDRPAMVCDARRGVTVHFAGGDNVRTTSGETWEWDGTRWTQVGGGAWPAPRAGHVMATGGPFGGVLVSSGQIGRERRTIDTLWQWNVLAGAPSRATARATVRSPRPHSTRREIRWCSMAAPVCSTTTATATRGNGTVRRGGPRVSHHRLAYDAARGVTLMFAGTETRSWDGTEWRRLATTGPSQRLVSAMAYDAGRRRVVLFGGSGPGGEPPYSSHADVWEWDGSRWVGAVRRLP